MKEKEIVVGIDVSKAVLDICLLTEGQSELKQIKNNVKSIQSFFYKLLKKNGDCKISVCMESTGYYNWPCYEAFAEMKLDLFVVNPLHLKKSIGLVRGKNDSIDSCRIARFIAANKVNLKPTLIPRKEIRTLQALVAQRGRLIDTKKRFAVSTKELILLADKKHFDKIKKSSEKMIKEIQSQVVTIEKEISLLINSDVELNEKFCYMTSVQGVGKVLAWAMLIKTNEFKSINNPRKLACYAGVVPFDFQSGTSIYKKPRVSVMADKVLKKLLHLAAMRAIQIKGELQMYYQRKVKEGKNKMSVLNAIRNKIVARVCAVVNNRKYYENSLFLS